MRVITVTNRKGGVGKSTFAAHLAAGLAIRGFRVGMVDTDSQGHLSMMFGLEPTNALYEVMINQKPIEDHILVLGADMYSTPDQPPAGALFLLSAYDRTYKIPHELDETEAFAGCNLMSNFGEVANLDYVIVDSQPSMTKLDGAVYLATDGFLFVTELETLAMRGLRDAVAQVERFSVQRDKWLNLPTEIVGIVPNKMRTNTVVHQENIGTLAQTYGRFKDGGFVLPPCRLLTVLSQGTDDDYISLTDIARYKNPDEPNAVISNWIRNRNTIEFLGIWEQLYNPNFKPLEFEGFKKEAGLNAFTLSPMKWVNSTNAIGIIVKPGRGGGTFAHKDIAFEFGINERQVDEYVTVCDSVPRDLRPDSPSISYSHIRLVSWNTYNDNQRSKHLALAAEKNLSVSQFNSYLKSLNKKPDSTKKTKALNKLNAQWVQVEKSLQRIVKADYLTRAEREEIRRQYIQKINELLRLDENARA